MNRSDEELIKRVFLAQKTSPTQGDLIKLVEKDLLELGISFEEAITSQMSKDKIKILARTAAFKDLLQQKDNHKKVKHNMYDKWEIQPYLKSDIFTEKETHTLTALRSQCTRGIKTNFKKMFKCDKCPLKCDPGNQIIDTPEHILTCSVLGNTSTVKIEDMHGSLENQHGLARIYLNLMTKRKTILEKLELDDSSHNNQVRSTRGTVPGPEPSASAGGGSCAADCTVA